MELLEKIFNHPQKIITVANLQKLLQEPDYDLFYHKVQEIVQTGVLVPVKSSGQNGCRPPLFKKYRITKPQTDFTRYNDDIRRLHHSLNIAGYLQKPRLYEKHLEIIAKISIYLWHNETLLAKLMSCKERSFSIWGREKLLDEQLALVKEVLKFNGKGTDFLNYYDTPEPFFEYVHNRSKSMTVLIIENKDTWFTFRKLMLESGRNNIARTAVDVLLYGEGNKISKLGALEEFKREMLGSQAGQAVRFLYFGDLDYEGIRLFFRAREGNPSLDLRPFSPLYKLMLKLAENRELPDSRDNRGVEAPLAEFSTLLELPDHEVLTKILAQGKYIPQETINYQVASDILS